MKAHFSKDGRMLYQHSFTNQIEGEIEYLVPYRWVIYYKDDVTEIRNVIRMRYMKTGCYVLYTTDNPDGVTLIPPGHHIRIVETPMTREAA